MSRHYPGRPLIDAYGNGGFRFAGMSHRGSILILPSGVHAWDGMGLGDVFRERDGIDLFLLGTGRAMARPPLKVREMFTTAGIQLDYMATGFAVSTYNLLLSEKRKVAAALLAVDDAG